MYSKTEYATQYPRQKYLSLIKSLKDCYNARTKYKQSTPEWRFSGPSPRSQPRLAGKGESVGNYTPAQFPCFLPQRSIYAASHPTGPCPGNCPGKPVWRRVNPAPRQVAPNARLTVFQPPLSRRVAFDAPAQPRRFPACARLFIDASTSSA